MTGEQETTPQQRTAPTGPEDVAVSRDPGTPDKAPDDAEDLRGFHFRRLIRKRSTLYWAGIPTVVVAIALAFGNLLWIPIILILGFLITVTVCWFKAMLGAENDFFNAYAEDRGLTRVEAGQLPGSTPLLRRGDERKAEEILEGPLGDGAAGTVALYTYTDVWYDKDRAPRDGLPLHGLDDRSPGVPPATARPLRQPQVRLPRLREARGRVPLQGAGQAQSEKLDEEYEIFSGKEQD